MSALHVDTLAQVRGACEFDDPVDLAFGCRLFGTLGPLDHRVGNQAHAVSIDLECGLLRPVQAVEHAALV